MGIFRSALLLGSENPWLRERARHSTIVRRSVSRFMPGELLENALSAAQHLQAHRIGTIVSHLGENLTHISEAEEATQQYLGALDQIEASGLGTQISVKPTQLGLDLDAELCYCNLLALVERAEKSANFVWIDMESAAYVDRTLALFKRLRQRSTRVGVCLQAYLYRTVEDIANLLPLNPAIRMVKGAYREPAAIAFPKKRDVDENYFRLTVKLLDAAVQRRGTFVGLGTHDPRLVFRILDYARQTQIAPSAYEVEMLFGIQRGLQAQLTREKHPLRILIVYGEQWFPWYMRRLAERPANVLFVAKNLFS